MLSACSQTNLIGYLSEIPTCEGHVDRAVDKVTDIPLGTPYGRELLVSFTLSSYSLCVLWHRVNICREADILKKYPFVLKLSPMNPHVRTYYVSFGSKGELEVGKGTMHCSAVWYIAYNPVSQSICSIHIKVIHFKCGV